MPDRKRRPTQTPTTETALMAMSKAAVVLVISGGNVIQRKFSGLDEHARTLLEMLHIPPEVYSTPREKWRPLEWGTSGT